MVIAFLILAPFLRTPFTIDDPLYLREAQHALVDPLHPQAFDIVWWADSKAHASEILPGGLFVPYFLLPAVWSGSSEFAGHVTTLVLLLFGLFGTARLALRLGLSESQARIATLLTATSAAVLGMAGTVMPDVPAMTFVVLGIERTVAWRDERKWHQALLATSFLTAAAMTRVHTILAIAVAAVFLLDGITVEEIRSSFRTFPWRFLPVVLTVALFFSIPLVITDPEYDGQIQDTIQDLLLGGPLPVSNLLAFLTHYALVIPLTIPWLVVRIRQINLILSAIVLAAAAIAAHYSGRVVFVATLTLFALADIGWDAVKKRDRDRLALWIWLFLAAPVVIYLHLPSKYLVPSVPAVAILIVQAMAQRDPARNRVARWLAPAIAVTGAVLGILILLGIRDLAESQRRAADELVFPLIQRGERVWYTGHWGFHWYAEQAGASAFTVSSLSDIHPGDVIVISEIDGSSILRSNVAHEVLQTISYPSGAPGRVMNFAARAGFFSNSYGYLPWVPGKGELTRFQVWQIE